MFVMIEGVYQWQLTARAWRRPSNSFRLPAEPHYKYIFIYRRGQHAAGFRQAACWWQLSVNLIIH